MENLDANVEYKFSIRASNRNGDDGTWGEWHFMNSNPKILPPTRPSTITKVISIDQKTDEIRLQWKPPASDGGSLLKYYRIYVTTESKQCGGEEVTIESEDQIPVTYVPGLEKMVPEPEPSPWYFKEMPPNPKLPPDTKFIIRMTAVSMARRKDCEPCVSNEIQSCMPMVEGCTSGGAECYTDCLLESHKSPALIVRTKEYNAQKLWKQGAENFVVYLN